MRPLPIWVRILAGLTFGVVVALVNWQLRLGQGMVFIVILFAGTAVVSVGLGRARLLVAAAVWLGQYSGFRWSFVQAFDPLSGQTAMILVHMMVIFLSAIAVLAGAYCGLLVEKTYRAADKDSR